MEEKKIIKLEEELKILRNTFITKFGYKTKENDYSIVVYNSSFDCDILADIFYISADEIKQFEDRLLYLNKTIEQLKIDAYSDMDLYSLYHLRTAKLNFIKDTFGSNIEIARYTAIDYGSTLYPLLNEIDIIDKAIEIKTNLIDTSDNCNGKKR